MAQRSGLVVRRCLERRGQGHQRPAPVARWLSGGEDGEHSRGGGEARVEELVGFIRATVVAEPRRRAEHREQHRDAAAEQQRAGGTRFGRRIGHVTDAAHRANHPGIELAAQVVHVNVERVALHVAVPAVERLLELRARQHLAGRRKQLVQRRTRAAAAPPARRRA